MQYSNGDIGFDIDGNHPPYSFIDKLNEILFNWMIYNDTLAIVEKDRVILNAKYTMHLSRIIVSVGYSQSPAGTFIWNKEEDLDDIKCRKAHIIKIA